MDCPGARANAVLGSGCAAFPQLASTWHRESSQYVARNLRLDRAKKMIAGKFRVVVAMQVLGDY
jgi:hypothetical protein